MLLKIFVIDTNLTFLAFFYNIDIESFEKVSAKNKIASSRNWTELHHWFRCLMLIQICNIIHYTLPVSDF